MKRVCINKVILSPADRNCSGSQPCKQRDPETLRAARLLRMTPSFGFTLVELLVVVLIIGILSAVAIPMYQGAVDKSHWSTMLPASKAIKDAEEAFKMTNGEYSGTMEHLDVQISNNDLTFTLNTPNNLADPNVIRVTNSKLDNVRLASYLDDSPKFAGQLHCEAKNEGSTPNERGQRLCEKLLNGQYVRTTDDGYTRYLLNQDIDKGTCEQAEGLFGQKTKMCYNTNGERCTGLGMPYNDKTEFCGYEAKDNLTVEEGGICKDGYNWSEQTYSHCEHSSFNNGLCIALFSCSNSEFNNNSVCLSAGSKSGEPGCHGGEFNNSLCISSNFYGGCSGSTFSNDSVCYASDEVYVAYGCASVTYNDTSCCCGGVSCPDAHRCSSERCAVVKQEAEEIKQQYQQLK